MKVNTTLFFYRSNLCIVSKSRTKVSPSSHIQPVFTCRSTIFFEVAWFRYLTYETRIRFDEVVQTRKLVIPFSFNFWISFFHESIFFVFFLKNLQEFVKFNVCRRKKMLVMVDRHVSPRQKGTVHTGMTTNLYVNICREVN